MSLFRKLFGGSKPQPTAPKDRHLSLPAMPAALYAVGDVHGCCELYQRLEQKILADGKDTPGAKLIVVLGDVIDRGPNSAGMLDHLLSPLPDGWQRVVLAGNHEEMAYGFLTQTNRNEAWLDYGGREMLLSYGMQEDPINGFKIPATTLQHAIDAHIPAAHIAFLGDLPLSLQVGPYLLAHAGYDPTQPIDTQGRADFLWGDPTRLDQTAGQWIAVHGHVPITEASAGATRIALDTGAYATGLLSAARLWPDGHCDIITAS